MESANLPSDLVPPLQVALLCVYGSQWFQHCLICGHPWLILNLVPCSCLFVEYGYCQQQVEIQIYSCKIQYKLCSVFIARRMLFTYVILLVPYSVTTSWYFLLRLLSSWATRFLSRVLFYMTLRLSILLHLDLRFCP